MLCKLVSARLVAVVEPRSWSEYSVLADNDYAPHTCFVHYIGKAVDFAPSNIFDIPGWRVKESGEPECLNIWVVHEQHITVEFP